jgi:D-serine deaminase-like pyridoxal phosphate-dependent protein
MLLEDEDVMLTDDIDTPALIVDLSLMEKNIASLADFFKGKTGKKFRPHFKTPKTPYVAWKEIRSGACGISCQKLSEAEVLVAAGIDDILITNEVVGEFKVKKLVGLLRNDPELKVCVDNLENAKALSEEASRKGVKLGVILDVDVGQNRCGVEPGKPAAELAKQVSELKSLEFKGIQAYHGILQMMDLTKGMEAKMKAIDVANRLTIDTKEAIEKNGVNVETVTGAGTGTYKQQYEVMDEVQPGSYPFMDWRYHKSSPEFHRALTILTSIMSKPTTDRVVVDCGGKAVSTDGGQPIIKDMDNVEYQTAGDEHGVLFFKGDRKDFALADKVELYPSHVCTTVNLYDRIYGVRDGEVEMILEVAARGKTQ